MPFPDSCHIATIAEMEQIHFLVTIFLNNMTNVSAPFFGIFAGKPGPHSFIDRNLEGLAK